MQRIRLVLLIVLVRVYPDYPLDRRSSGACPGGGTLRCSLQRGFGFVGRESARAGDVPAVDHGEARHLACQCG